MRKPRFNRTCKFFFLKDYRQTADVTFEAGSPVPDSMRLFRLRSLYQRNKIGMVGDPWAKVMLESGTVTRITRHHKDEAARLRNGLTVDQWASLDGSAKYLMLNTPPGILEPVIDVPENTGKESDGKPDDTPEQTNESSDTGPEGGGDEPEDTSFLLGSNYYPAHFKTAEGEEIQLGAVVSFAFEQSELTNDAWNDQDEDALEDAIQSAVVAMAVTPVEDCVVPVGGGWFEVWTGGEMSKVQGKEAAEAKLKG